VRGLDGAGGARPGALVPRHEGLPEAREEDVLEGNQPRDVSRSAPVRVAVDERHRLCFRDRVAGNVEGALATADDRRRRFGLQPAWDSSTGSSAGSLP
jgi:hypothetical protein